MISALLICQHRRSFLLQQVGTNTEIQSETIDWETLSYLALNESSPSNISFQDSENPSVKETVRLQEETEGTKETRCSERSMSDAHINLQRLCDGVHMAFPRWEPSVEKRSGHTFTSLTWRQLLDDNHLQVKISILQRSLPGEIN